MSYLYLTKKIEIHLLKDQGVRKKLLRFVLFFFTTIWVVGIFSPCFDFNFTGVLYPFQKQLYSTVCHQNPLKSFICNDIPFFVCARCTGIYVGALISGMVLLVFSKQFIFSTKYLIIFSLPMLIDVILLNFGTYSYNHILSAFTGLLFSSSVFLYILSAIENLLFSK